MTGGDHSDSPRVLILDYSVDRSEAPLFSKWLPDHCLRTDAFVFFGDPIPSPEGFTHVMHTGSSLSIREDAVFIPEAAGLIRDCVRTGIPQMGVCYGHQLMCRALLGPSSVGRCPGGIEAGWIDISLKGSGLGIPGTEPVIRVLQSHFDRVMTLPEGAEVIASNGHTEVQAFADGKRRLLGFQFHPEFDRDTGNRLFMKERELLERNGVDVDRVLETGPSINTGRIFFDYFLSGCWFRS
ncbi:MAG: type 1 glutamine amidotransferase [Candidatus Fermentibacteraceae bacterium]|nr:type 1 glutamine amidotransferase [Candidatus Fermentibacteraceae bacterium]MBN2607934.1 type 1 glutamine amidotransferase [Candidatus Fermentibacteraceae bacterium]